MSGITTSIKNAFKHPEDIVDTSSTETTEESIPRAQSQTRSSAPASQTHVQQQVSTQSRETETDKLAGQHELSHAEIPHAVPSTGYVGDETGGRFPIHHQQDTASTPTTTPSHGTSSTAAAAAGSDGSKHATGTNGTGREGVPGTTTGGDPSMGGKFTRAQGAT